MCIRDSNQIAPLMTMFFLITYAVLNGVVLLEQVMGLTSFRPVSYTHLRAHETVLDLVCRLLLQKKKYIRPYNMKHRKATSFV